MRLTELVEDLCSRGVEAEDADPNPPVVVLVDAAELLAELELERVAVGDGRIVLHCRKP